MSLDTHPATESRRRARPYSSTQGLVGAALLVALSAGSIGCGPLSAAHARHETFSPTRTSQERADEVENGGEE